MSWNEADLENQANKTVVITGANSGIGYSAARMLAEKDARVILACRNLDKAAIACDEIRTGYPGASVSMVELDLSSIASIRRCAAELEQSAPTIDVLINNAGIMAIPRAETADGFEMQLGTNHLGHFALTALLFERLQEAPEARIVTVSSLAHQFGFINFLNLHSRVFYDPWAAYGQSKLANLLFTYELARRCDDADLPISALACHPGASATNLPQAGLANSPFGQAMVSFFSDTIAQSADKGALPTLYAGFAKMAENGQYIGPDGIGEFRGEPRVVSSNLMSRSEPLASELWRVSERETGITFTV